MLLIKRRESIDQFAKNNIISRGEKFYDAPKRSEESIPEKSEQKSDQSIPKWLQVPKDRFNFIKLKINTNKELTTMIDSQRYILNDTNELVNKIAEKKISKNNAIKAYNNLVNKLEKTDLPDSSYSIANIQDYFEFIIKKHETLTENPPIQIYPNKIKNRIVFKIKTS